MEQSVRLRCFPRLRFDPIAEEGDTSRLELGQASLGFFPDVVLGASTAAEPAPPSHTTVAPGPVLVELDLRSKNWRAALIRAARDAGGGALDARLITSEEQQIRPAVTALAEYPLLRIGAFDSRTHLAEQSLRDALRAALDETGVEVPLLTGTRAHFTELNRNAARLRTAEHPVTFSITPQMHDRSRQQVIESIPMQRLVAEQAVRLAAGADVHIGPVTLRPRFNAVATSQPVPIEAHDIAAGYGPQIRPGCHRSPPGFHCGRRMVDRQRNRIDRSGGSQPELFRGMGATRRAVRRRQRHAPSGRGSLRLAAHHCRLGSVGDRRFEPRADGSARPPRQPRGGGARCQCRRRTVVGPDPDTRAAASSPDAQTLRRRPPTLGFD